MADSKNDVNPRQSRPELAASDTSRAPQTITFQPNAQQAVAASAQAAQLDACAKTELLPPSFGRYRVIRRLGSGGMGDVYLAEDAKLERKVAIKVPKLSAGETPEVLDRFLTEARSVARLKHRNICKIYDIADQNGILYFVMEYIDGVELSSIIRMANQAGQLIPAISSIRLVRQLALALQSAHDQQIVHRDLKPSNIMFDRSAREPIIMDFGLARQGKPTDAGMTEQGMILGTAAYMPPEQARGELERIGAPSDIYSLGAVLFELLTGRRLFTGNFADVLSKVLHQPPASPSSLRGDLDPQVDAICLKALDKEPERRFTSMTEFAAALTDLLRQLPANDANENDPFAALLTATLDKQANRAAAGQSSSPKGVRSLSIKQRLAVGSLAIGLLVGVVWAIFPPSRNLGERAHNGQNGDSGSQPALSPTPIADNPPREVSLRFDARRWETLDVLRHLQRNELALPHSWQLEGGSLLHRGDETKSLELPIQNLPREYSLSFTGIRSGTAIGQEPLLALTLPLESQTASVFLTGEFGDETLAGIRTTAGWVPETVVPGPRLPVGSLFAIRVIVRAKQIEVFLNGRQFLDWQGDPHELTANESLAPVSPGTIGLHCAGDHTFKAMQIAPLHLPAATEIDLLPLVDLTHDTLYGTFLLAKESIIGKGTEIAHAFRLPIEPPAEYTLIIGGERLDGPNNPKQRPLLVGLNRGGYSFSAIVDLRDDFSGGLDLLDSKAAIDSFAVSSESRLLDGVPFELHATVTNRRVALAIDRKQVLNWEGAADRLSRAPWAADLHPHDLFLGMGTCLFRFNKVVLKSPENPDVEIPEAPRDEVDLLALINPTRDAVNGIFQKVGNAIVTPKESRPRLNVPYLMPAEYQLRATVVAPERVDSFVLELPTAHNRVECNLNARRGTSGLLWLSGRWGDGVHAYIGRRVFPSGRESQLLIEVRRSSITVECDGEPVLQWRGNALQTATATLARGNNFARQLGLGSLDTSYVVKSLMLCPLPEQDFDPLPSETEVSPGENILAVMDSARDNLTENRWQSEGGAFTSPKVPFTDSVLQVPQDLPDEYSVRLQVARKADSPYGLHLIIPVGRVACDVALDAWFTPCSGIQRLHGQELLFQPLCHRGAVLTGSESHEVIVTLRRADALRYRIQVAADGRTVCDTTAYPAELSEQGTQRSFPLSFRSPRRMCLKTLGMFAVSALRIEAPLTLPDRQIVLETPPPAEATFPDPLVRGNWHVERGVLSTNGTPSTEGMIHFGDPGWQDYDLAVEVMEDRKEPSGRLDMRLGVLIRADTPMGHHWLTEIGSWGSSRNFDLLAITPGENEFKTPVRRYMGGRLPGYTHQWQTVQIRVRGEDITVMLNEEVIATSKHPKILSGRVGVSTLNTGGINRWRNLEVRDPAGKLLWQGWPALKKSP